MDLLLDTSAFLFLCLNDPRLTIRAQQVILDPANRCLISIASVWEIAIKLNVGKIQLGLPLDAFMDYHAQAYDLEIVPIEIPQLLKVSQFQQAHKDPFDRVIIATGLVRSIPIVTSDPEFVGFGVAVIW